MTARSPETITFFIDRCLGKKLASVLREQDISVEIHDDHFAKDAVDVDWLPNVGKRGWVVLTKDERIAKRNLERLAVASARIKMFVLVSQNLSGNDMAAAFLKAIPAMEQFIKTLSTPFIAKVYRDGRVETWKTPQELLDELENQ